MKPLNPRSSPVVLLLGGVVLAMACSTAPPPRVPPPSSVTTSTLAEVPTTEPSEKEATACELECGNATLSARPSTPDHHAAAVENADEVFRSMHDDLLACYRKTLRGRPSSHAFMTVDVVVKEDGSVGWIETTGGAHFGDRGLRCLTDRIQRAHFLPVVGGGTRRIHVPLTFRTLAPGEDI